jgi:VWFA-related protein
MRSMTLMICLGFALLVCGYSTEQKSARQPGSNQAIRVNVDMVSLPVVVTTRDGKRVTDLNQEDFQVFENGVRQDIAGFAATDEPVEVVLLLDTSGSTEHKLARIQNAAIDFVNELHPDDEVAVISFADDVRLQGDFSIDRDKIEYGIKKTRTGGWTVLYEAVWLALEEVLKPIKERKALVLFTDGVDTRSEKASENETLELAKETQATIYCVYYYTELDRRGTWPRSTGGGYPSPLPPIVINPPPPISRIPGSSTSEDFMRGREYLSKLAEYSGGLVFDGNENLSDAFKQVAKELASQYSIGYYSNATKNDGKFRKVQVKVNKPGLAARTKKGYFAKKG